MNLRSLDETLLDCAFADIASLDDDFIALLPAAAVVPTLLELCVLAVTCAPTAAAKQNETAPTSAGSEYVRDMGFLRWVADLAPRGAGALGRYGASESSSSAISMRIALFATLRGAHAPGREFASVLPARMAISPSCQASNDRRIFVLLIA